MIRERSANVESGEESAVPVEIEMRTLQVKPKQQG
jgi:hypothetical protein